MSATLQLGTAAESVTITAELTGIESDQSVTGQLLSTKQLSELPLNGRSFFMMLQYSTGVIFTNQNWVTTGWSMPNQWATSSAAGNVFTAEANLRGVTKYVRN